MSDENNEVAAKLAKLGKHFRLALSNFPPENAKTRRKVQEAILDAYAEQCAERRQRREEAEKKYPDLTIFKKKKPKKPTLKPK